MFKCLNLLHIVHPLMVEAIILIQMAWPVQTKLLYCVARWLMKYVYFQTPPRVWSCWVAARKEDVSSWQLAGWRSWSASAGDPGRPLSSHGPWVTGNSTQSHPSSPTPSTRGRLRMALIGWLLSPQVRSHIKAGSSLGPLFGKPSFWLCRNLEGFFRLKYFWIGQKNV